MRISFRTGLKNMRIRTFRGVRRILLESQQNLLDPPIKLHFLTIFPPPWAVYSSASFCLWRQWKMRQEVNAVTVQSDSWSTGSVAVLTGVHVHAWLSKGCCCPTLSSALSRGVPQVFSLPLACPDPCFEGKTPTVAVCSCSLPACWVGVACLQISFANVCISRNRPSCRSGASSKLSIQHVLGNSTIFQFIGSLLAVYWHSIIL